MSSNSSVVSTAALSVFSASAAALLLLRSSERSKSHSTSKDSGSVGTAATEISSVSGDHHYVDVEATLKSIHEAFPGAVPNNELVALLRNTLAASGYDGNTTLVATALCCDELNRPLVDDLEREFGQTFTMGGLAGFAFGGVTSFGAMAHHIPDGGNCLLVYGPHVGVDSEGNVGTVNRRGRKHGGACCGSASAAAGYVHQEYCKQITDDSVNTFNSVNTISNDPLDAQQQFVNNLLLPYGKRLEEAEDKKAELPKALFDAQNELVQRIVAKGASNVGGRGKIAMVGGVQINTPPGMQDYFLPLRFELRNNKGALVEDFMAHRSAILPTVESITQHFPRAMPNNALVSRVQAKLAECGYNEKSTLLATSLCCDEVNKPLIDDFSAVYGNNFSMGGLAGFAFGGVTSFGAMAHHIPDDGSCLIVFGPHVGVDSKGNVGTIDRIGRKKIGACCGSAAAASGFVHEQYCKKVTDAVSVSDPQDAQQQFVNSLLLPQAERLEQAKNRNVELPFALFDAQQDLLRKIVAKGCGEVAGDGKIALLGGIQINTPSSSCKEGMYDYFLPLSFELRNNKGELIEDLLWEE
ncbi:Inherit from NOG: Low-co2 inducible protein [Seminavis robusta]|uniref:Inherit from NOG: Low-co2 inducible protein n=1 Tax=Seminavis robusta TaxID=568900 RepID=A0A9N8EVP6_9STRA|nr:Inherit from NOG: Low-co2 inducible protein [Seminavis robusta]|eukprot:Sro2017_g311180.1 Inherit from NOG: Low-co2 inducible protein (581) ;mRNA; r:1667-3617